MEPENLTGNEPIELGERKPGEARKEAVVPEDVEKIMKFNKDALYS